MQPLATRDFISAFTNSACAGGMRFAKTAPGKCFSLYGEAVDDPRQESSRKLCTLTPSRKYDTSSSRSECPCRTTASQNSTCLRTSPGTNSLPPVPESHTGACHGRRRDCPCIGSLSMSAQDGSVLGGVVIAPVSTQPRSSADNTGAGGRVGRTWAWRRSRFRNHSSEFTYRMRAR